MPASGQDTILRDVAASVGGPTLVAYVAWVLNDAQRRGIEHLHFLSRDGQVLLEIACRLAPKLGYAGQLAYLACSRKATNFAAFGADLAREAPWLWTRQSSPTCASLLAQVGIEPNEIESELAALGLLSDTWLRPLDERRRQRLLAFLQGPYRPRLDARHAEQRALVLDYLDGEGFLKDAPVGVVDLGGAGSQYRALRILRQQMDRSAPTGFVAHLDRPPAGDHEAAGALADDDLHAWLNDMRRNLGFPRFQGLAAVLLMYCKADHGTVVAYRRRGGRVEPILAPTSGSERAQRQFRIVRDTILRVADEVVLDDALVNPRADVRRPVWEALLLFWKRPSRAEAATLQWLELEESPHPDRDGGDRLASPYGVTDLVHLLRHRAWPGPWYSWPNASVEVSPTPIRGLLKAALWLRRRRPRRG